MLNHTKYEVHNQAILEKFYVEDSSKLIVQDNFGGKAQEPDFSHTFLIHNRHNIVIIR